MARCRLAASAAPTLALLLGAVGLPAQGPLGPVPEPATLPADQGRTEPAVIHAAPDPEGMLTHVVLLQQRLLKAQKNLLFVIEDEWVRIAARDNETSPERAVQVGAEVKGHVRLLNGLQGQLTSAFLTMRASDPEAWPPTLRMRFMDLQREIEEKRWTLQDGLLGLREHLGISGAPGGAGVPPMDPVELDADPDARIGSGRSPEGEGGDEGEDPDDPPAPDEPEEVGKKILTGRVATPADVVSVFERLPDAPVGSLEELRRHAER